MKKKYRMTWDQYINKGFSTKKIRTTDIVELEEIKEEEPKKASKKEINKAFKSGGFTTYEGFKFIEPKGLEEKIRKIIDERQFNGTFVLNSELAQIARDEAVRVFDKAMGVDDWEKEKHMMSKFIINTRQALKSM